MVNLFASSGDPDQMPHSAASDLGLHCLPITLLGVSRLQWVTPVLGGHMKPCKLCCCHMRVSMEPILQVFSFFFSICFQGHLLQILFACELSAWPTIHMKCQALFSLKYLVFECCQLLL